ncbi:MAG: phosphotransferase [Patescibacteria group bacterium]
MKNKISNLFTKICKKYSLNPIHQMSTARHFFVWLLENKNHNQYLLKIRKQPDPKYRAKFIIEITFNAFLSKKIKMPKKLFYSYKKSPEYLLYSFIKGAPLNHIYFFIDPKIIKKIKNSKPIINYLKLLQSQTNSFLKICKKNKIKLKSHFFKENYLFFKKYSKNLNLIFTKNQIKQIEEFIIQNKKEFNTDLVLAHGDFHPKNILITPNKKISVIDWSDLQLNNQYFDLAFLWLCSWNIPAQQKIIQKNIKNKKLFYLNILIWLPKYCQILEDANQAAHKEYQNKIINRQQKEYLLKLIQDSKKQLKNKYAKINPTRHQRKLHS